MDGRHNKLDFFSVFSDVTGLDSKLGLCQEGELESDSQCL